MPDFDKFVVPSTADDYVELTTRVRGQKGRLFKKHILNKGPLHHPSSPGTVINIDDDFVAKLTENFANGACDIVQVPKAGKNNEHSEDPDRNIGEVIGIEAEGDKVYAVIDARTDDAEKLGKTLLGASAMMSLDYTDTHTNTKVGPTLLHVAVTNRPYVTGLEEFEELVAASADGTGETTVLLSAATGQENVMTLEELLGALKEDHGIDVEALQTAAAQKTETASLSQAAETLASVGVLSLSNGQEVPADQIVSGITELVDNNKALVARLSKIETDAALAAAESSVDALVGEGRVLPAQRDAMVKLKLSNTELFDALVPEKALVALSVESGSTPVDDQPNKDIDAIIARYADDSFTAA